MSILENLPHEAPAPAEDETITTTSLTTDAASRTDASGTFSVCTWNILTGRGGGLESACRALAAANVDIAVLQETKIINGVYTRCSSGYTIIASEAVSKQQGGPMLWPLG